jgi:hypothetical protein
VELVIKNGGMARVDISDERPLQGALVWMFAPRMFEVIAE